MLNALRFTLLLVPHLAEAARIGWVAGRRNDHLVVVAETDNGGHQSWLHVKQAILEALTDDEYAAYEQTLPIAEQHRRLALTWQWRNLSRRAAMLEHLARFDDVSYAAYEKRLPTTEMERRVLAMTAERLDMVLNVPGQEEREPAFA